MTATDELRLPNDTKELDALLNERGQEHRVWPSGLVVWHDERTVYEYEPAKNHHSEYWGGILRMTMRHLTPEQAIEATLGETPTPPPPTMPEQPPYDELIESLRRDWDIEASWDGLRRFWCVCLTDEGVRKRDEREATLGRGTCDKDSRYTAARAENAKLRELVRDMWHDGMCECDERGACAECEYHFPDRMRELGVEEPSRWATCECGEDVELFEGCHEAVCPSCGRVVRG